jgi:hypothetical protein
MEIVRFPATHMKNNPLVTVLLGLLTLSVLGSVAFCLFFTTSTRKLNTLRSQANFVAYRRQFMSMLVNDTLEYSKTHPAIEPTLESLRLRNAKAAATATNKPASK